MFSILKLILSVGFASAAANEIILATFDGTEATRRSWRVVNDPVMGGRSTGTFTVVGGLGIFDGEVVDVPYLRVPGFIKAVATDSKPFPDIRGCAAIDIIVRATGTYAGYRFSFGNAHAPHGKLFAYGYKSHFVPMEGHFSKVSIPLTNFTDYWDDATGEPIKACQDDPVYCPDAKTLQNMKTITVWAEGARGKVHLEIRSFQASGCSADEASTKAETVPPISF